MWLCLLRCSAAVGGRSSLLVGWEQVRLVQLRPSGGRGRRGQRVPSRGRRTTAGPALAEGLARGLGEGVVVGGSHGPGSPLGRVVRLWATGQALGSVVAVVHQSH